jgi:hypothetical protein
VLNLPEATRDANGQEQRRTLFAMRRDDPAAMLAEFVSRGGIARPAATRAPGLAEAKRYRHRRRRRTLPDGHREKDTMALIRLMLSC